MRRLKREGFMQLKVYSAFGYYPWECPICRDPMLVRRQYMRPKSSVQKNSTS
jgi:hypothetical protein